MLKSTRLVGLCLAIAGISILASCTPAAKVQDNSPEANFELRLNEEYAFKPSNFDCTPGQILRFRISNIIPQDGPEIIHNVILLRAGTDVAAFAEACTNATEAESYVPANLFAKVLAATTLIKPGRSEQLLIFAPEVEGVYHILCSFPGHYLLGMHGTLTVKSPAKVK